MIIKFTSRTENCITRLMNMRILIESNCENIFLPSWEKSQVSIQINGLINKFLINLHN